MASVSKGTERRIGRAYAKLPLSFIPNAGQADKRVRYYAQDAGHAFYFTKDKVVLAFTKGRRGVALQLAPLGSNPNARLEASDRGQGRVNYLSGSEHHTNLRTYQRLTYRGLWPGVDMVIRGNEGKLKYEFRVRPGADPSDVRLAYAGAEKLSLGAGGNLLIHTSLGTVRDSRPRSYQRIGGRRVAVESSYVLDKAGQSRYGFAFGAYDRGRPLVIDPSLAYSTNLGGSNADTGNAIAVDASGSAYVTGTTASADFPTTVGAFDSSLGAAPDVFVTKLNPSGSGLVFSTYVGGSDLDEGRGIAVDGSGSAYVTGTTISADFPTTAGAFNTGPRRLRDAFVTKLDTTGSSLLFSTYLGGSSTDEARGIAVDGSGSAYVTGRTQSADFPTTAGAFDTEGNSEDAFVTKVNPSGSGLLFSTYLGGSVFAGVFGSAFDEGRGITVDGSGSAYVIGETFSTDFPTTAGAFDTSQGGGGFGDAFVAKVDASGSSLLFSTYLGGSNADDADGIAVDRSGSAYVTGQSFSSDFPITAGAFSTSPGGGSDAFVTKLNATGASLLFSTYLGGDEGHAIVVDAAGSAFVTGATSSPGFPTTAGAFDTSPGGGSDAFVTRIPFGPGAPAATLALSPKADTNDVDTQHCVTATVAHAAGNPVPHVTVRFTVTGSVNSSASDATDTSGEATFCYQGPALPGTDAIQAFADTDEDGAHDPGEPSDTATKTWVPPASTPRCKVTNSGRITTASGDRATFRGNAKTTNPPRGSEKYTDYGPGTPIEVNSLEVRAVICSSERREASIFGTATVGGVGSFDYRIDVNDLGGPGRNDTYRIRLSSGYDSGEHGLKAGNVQIRD